MMEFPPPEFPIEVQPLGASFRCKTNSSVSDNVVEVLGATRVQRDARDADKITYRVHAHGWFVSFS